jgi:hypothetical protein
LVQPQKTCSPLLSGPLPRPFRPRANPQGEGGGSRSNRYGTGDGSSPTGTEVQDPSWLVWPQKTYSDGSVAQRGFPAACAALSGLSGGSLKGGGAQHGKVGTLGAAVEPEPLEEQQRQN